MLLSSHSSFVSLYVDGCQICVYRRTGNRYQAPLGRNRNRTISEVNKTRQDESRLDRIRTRYVRKKLRRLDEGQIGTLPRAFSPVDVDVNLDAAGSGNAEVGKPLWHTARHMLSSYSPCFRFCSRSAVPHLSTSICPSLSRHCPVPSRLGLSWSSFFCFNHPPCPGRTPRCGDTTQSRSQTLSDLSASCDFPYRGVQRRSRKGLLRGRVLRFLVRYRRGGGLLESVLGCGTALWDARSFDAWAARTGFATHHRFRVHLSFCLLFFDLVFLLLRCVQLLYPFFEFQPTFYCFNLPLSLALTNRVLTICLFPLGFDCVYGSGICVTVVTWSLIAEGLSSGSPPAHSDMTRAPISLKLQTPVCPSIIKIEPCRKLPGGSTSHAHEMLDTVL